MPVQTTQFIDISRMNGMMLEVRKELSTDACILCIRKFVIFGLTSNIELLNN